MRNDEYDQNEMTRFAGKNILITGGSTGIGLATAQRLVDEGAKLIITGRSEEKLQNAAKHAPSIRTLQNDAADPSDGEKLRRVVQNEFGQLDGLFLNAAFGRFGPLSEIAFDDVDAQMRTNIFGPIQHAVLLKDLVVDDGSILFTGSNSVYAGQPLSAVYSATKAAVRAFARSLSRELAPRGIRVNTLSPGPIATEFFETAGYAGEQLKALEERVRQVVPLRRMGQPGEVAAFAAFLLSDEASYVSGGEYFVDGGMTMA